MTLNYFGTDGIRGRAHESPLSLPEVARWGQAWGQVAASKGVSRLLLGWDPRASSEPMAQALLQGLDGFPCTVLGVVPTPAVALLTLQTPGAWGIMLSASHNPPEDNGIKGFNGLGEKLEEEEEQAIESAFGLASVSDATLPFLHPETGLVERYLSHLGIVELPDDCPIVVDCAHGATASFAPRVLRGTIHWIGVPADGARINVGVGSTHLGALREAVKDTGAELGIAFDGDGDRCLMVDSKGGLVDGDQMLWLLAQDRLEAGEALPGIVGTVMTNGALEAALAARGVAFVRTPVGDKFLLRELQTRGWDLAAEASGHLIQKREGPSGDGLATAMALLRALLHRPKLDRWSWRFEPWPLKLVNLTARERRAVEDCQALSAAMRSLEARHGGAGGSLRMVVRWSGTEPKLRLMAEAREPALLASAMVTLETAARADLGIS
ncbi:MAG: phosphoglucosamine mutase [Acidobacteriota bacterium]|nr:phosphoglucosamine mutase [Acidobacteriota bacterium]